jgi:AcrR family transcriptional regulator
MATEAKNERPLRADAERNRLRILDAAADLFAERGLQVSLDEVAERAGVGVGTVYRRFADREALVDAVLESRIEEFVGIAEAAAANPDPWQGLQELIERGAEFHGRNRALKELMFSAPGGREWVDGVRRRMRPLSEGLVTAAQEQGKLRDDLDTLDVPLTMLMLASAIEFTADTDADNWRRLLGIVLDGFASERDRPTPLDADPLTQAELTQAMKRSSRSRG